MLIRANPDLVLRPETFGASVYVPDRDDIFLIGQEGANFVLAASQDWVDSSGLLFDARRYAQLGVIQAKDQNGLVETASFLEKHVIDVDLFPIVEKPLLVNCFSTAWCPLKCVYCHADDLMSDEMRRSEEDSQVGNVAALAKKLNALVYVVTGGDPLTAPSRAVELLRSLPSASATVIDTSGVGSENDLLSILGVRKSHLRVSIDSPDPRINSKLRPINQKHFSGLAKGELKSIHYAERALEIGREEATGVTVQTVLTKFTDSLDHLLQLRDWLVSRGVRHWVLHCAINAGSAHRSFMQKRRSGVAAAQAGVFPSASVQTAIRDLVADTIANRIPMDIRTTDANGAPNSVFLVGSSGDLFVQSIGVSGSKKKLVKDIDVSRGSLWSVFGDAAHVKRYTNLDNS